MDRFNFFDHPSLRQSPTANNHNSSPLLPQNNLLQQVAQQTNPHSQHPTPQQSHPTTQHPPHHPSSHHQPSHHPQHLSHHQQQQHHQQQRIHSQQQHHHSSQLQHSSALNQQSQSNHQPHSQPQHHRQLQQQLHLQPMDSANPHSHDPVSAAVAASHHSTSQNLHHRQQHQQPVSHQFQIHQLQQPNQSQHHQQQHPHSQHHPQSSPNHLSAIPLSHAPSQITTLALPANSNNSAFSNQPVNPLTQTTSQYNHTMSRAETQQQHHQHSQFHNMSQIPQPSTSNNAFAAAAQPLQMPPVLPSQQQPSQAPSFGSLANLPGAMIPPGVVDDPSSSHHFQTAQSGDALSAAYPWDTTHPQASLGSQNLAAAQNQQQPLLPLIGDTRTNNNISNPASGQSFHASANGQGNFGAGLNNSMNVLGSSLNASNMVGTMSGSGTDLSKRATNSLSLSVTDGGTKAGKTVKKARVLGLRKTASTRGRVARPMHQMPPPITSPVSNATLPNLKQQPLIMKNNNPMQNRAMNRVAMRGGKVKGRGRARGMEEEGNHAGGLTATTNITGVQSMPPISRTDVVQVGGGGGITSNVTTAQQQNAFMQARNPVVTPSCQVKKQSASRSRTRRRNPDGTPAATVPVHLRNPKKGRARVFRECSHCQTENHIRRADCVHCKSPLPAGKRRKDGNPLYDRKNSSTSAIPNTHVVPQQLGNSRGGLKEEIGVSPVISK